MTLTVRLPAELEKKLTKIAHRTHRSKSSFVCQALQTYLEDQEDYYDALERKKRFQKGQDKPISLSEIKESLGLK